MKYLLPGSLTLAMFVSVMIGGGMLYIDDKARGVHEGYLVTPITKLELVLGLNLAGAIKAVMTGVIICVIGSLIAGVSTIFNPATIFGLLIMIVLTSLAFNTMMFLLMVRIEDPLVPRAMFGILNTLLFFPSGAIYPIQAFPPWLRAIAKCRSVYLRCGWLQMSAAEGNYTGGGMGRHAIPGHLRRGYAGDRDSFVQANAVEIIRWVVQRMSRESCRLRRVTQHDPDCSSVPPETFDLRTASVILESYDSTGRQRVPSRKRAEEKNANYFHYRSCPDPGRRGLVESVLAGKTDCE